MSYDSSLDALFAILLTYLLFAFIYAIFSYIVNGLFFSKVGKDINDDSRWMAWVPVANTYYTGKLAAKITNDIDFFNKFKIGFWGTLAATLVETIMSRILKTPDANSFIIVLSLILSVATIALAIFFMVMQLIALYRIFQFYAPEKSTLYLVLSIIIPIAEQIIFIIMMGRVVGKGYVSQQKPPIDDNYNYPRNF